MAGLAEKLTINHQKNINDLVSLQNLESHFAVKVEYQGEIVDAVYIGTFEEQERDSHTKSMASVIFRYAENENSKPTIRRSDFTTKKAKLKTSPKGLFLDYEQLKTISIATSQRVKHWHATNTTYTRILNSFLKPPSPLTKKLLLEEEAIAVFTPRSRNQVVAAYLSQKHYFSDEYRGMKVSRFIWQEPNDQKGRRKILSLDVMQKNVKVTNIVTTKDGKTIYLVQRTKEGSFHTKHQTSYPNSRIGRSPHEKPGLFHSYRRILKNIGILKE